MNAVAISKPLFISFEGGEGSGKTTQINKLAEYLTKKNYKVLTTREPGGTPEGEKIRDILVQREGGDWDPVSECLLLYAARVMHVGKIIKPALEKGKIVISDRFHDSTFAYQGYGRGLDIAEIHKLHVIALGGFKPDLTIILDIDPEQGLRRSNRRLSAETLKVHQTEDRFENMEMEFHQRLREGFLDIAKKEPQRCIVVDAAGSLEAISRYITEIVSERL